jgi:hypothetical protein
MLRAFISSALFTAILYLIPMLFPFFTPGKWQLTNKADFLRQFTFFHMALCWSGFSIFPVVVKLWVFDKNTWNDNLVHPAKGVCIKVAMSSLNAW